MYQTYWDLTSAPFECNLDPSFYCDSTSHAAAILKLQYLIEQHKGAGVLAAGSGFGKTYVTHVLEQKLDEQFRPFVRLLYPRLDAAGILSQIAVRLGVDADKVDSQTVGTDQIVELLKNQLKTLGKAGRRPVIVIDDAHLIESCEVWHALRLLLNFREQDCHLTSGANFTLLLVGQPQLMGMLRGFGDLYERLAVRVSLAPLTVDEVAHYVESRMAKAGVSQPVFTPDSLAALADLSGGNPRKVNQLADLTLLVGYADKLDRITGNEITAASDEMLIASID